MGEHDGARIECDLNVRGQRLVRHHRKQRAQPQAAARIPTIPAAHDSTSDSLSSCLTTCQLRAPSARRSASSRRRADARASCSVPRCARDDREQHHRAEQRHQ